MELLLTIGVVAGINWLIIYLKFKKSMYMNAFIDIGAFVIFTMLAKGTLGGLVIATIASLIVSIGLFISPPKGIAV